MFRCFLAAEVFEWVRPQQVAHWTERRRLFESVQLHPTTPQSSANYTLEQLAQRCITANGKILKPSRDHYDAYFVDDMS